MLRRIAAVATLFFLAGCESSVVTRFDPGVDPDQVTVEVVLTGAVVDALDEKPALDEQLAAAFTDTAGVPPQRRRAEIDGERALILSADVPIATVTAASGLTGISGLSVTGEDPVSVSVSFTEPVKLRDALEGFGDEAATNVALASTFVTLELRLGGGVDQVVGQVPYTEEDGTVVVRQAVGSFVPGSLVVTGGTQDGSWWMWVVAAAVLAGGLTVVLRRKR